MQKVENIMFGYKCTSNMENYNEYNSSSAIKMHEKRNKGVDK